jgi:pyroglutamyl-peptidase
MTLTILLTGFGPFPGARFNPTGPLVRALARRRSRTGTRRVAHVFRTSYEAVDRDLPALLAREKPDVLVMFGLAARARHIRIETRARNALSLAVPDVAGFVPAAATITDDAMLELPLRAPARQLAAAARSAGVPAQVSRDAGSYLCNYLCWRASEAGARPGGPRMVTFVHVPPVWNTGATHSRCPPFTFAHLEHAGEAIVRAAVAAARGRY